MTVFAGGAFVGRMGVIIKLAMGCRIEHVASGEMCPFLDRAGAIENLGHRVLAAVGQRRRAFDRFSGRII